MESHATVSSGRQVHEPAAPTSPSDRAARPGRDVFSHQTVRRRVERTVQVHADPPALFARLDDQTRLGEHMQRPSAMMGGGKMTFEFDEARGQAVGSHIKMGGTAFGLSLFVDEIVVDRDPPARKSWRTTEHTRLIIIEAYDMGFDIEPEAEGSRLRVWIDFDLPRGILGGLLGRLLGPGYARWCVDRMANDASAHFAASALPA